MGCAEGAGGGGGEGCGGLSGALPQPGNMRYWHVKPLVCSKLFVLLLKGFLIYVAECKQPEGLKYPPTCVRELC